MMYRGYKAHVDYNDETKMYTGTISGIKNIVHFQAPTLMELKLQFIDSVEQYLASLPPESHENP